MAKIHTEVKVDSKSYSCSAHGSIFLLPKQLVLEDTEAPQNAAEPAQWGRALSCGLVQAAETAKNVFSD